MAADSEKLKNKIKSDWESNELNIKGSLAEINRNWQTTQAEMAASEFAPSSITTGTTTAPIWRYNGKNYSSRDSMENAMARDIAAAKSVTTTSGGYPTGTTLADIFGWGYAHSGGYIRPGGRMGNMKSDEGKIVVQTGEGILSRRGMKAMGGSEVLESLNQGVFPFGMQGLDSFRRPQTESPRPPASVPVRSPVETSSSTATPQGMTIILELDGDKLAEWVYDGSKDGRVRLHERGLVSI